MRCRPQVLGSGKTPPRKGNKNVAQKVEVTLIDDTDGSESPDVTTVLFGYDGTDYEIDLSGENKDILEKRLAQFIASARRLGRSTHHPSPNGHTPTAGRRRSAAARSGPSRERSADIRAWAKDRGVKVSERGRIPQAVVADYEASH